MTELPLVMKKGIERDLKGYVRKSMPRKGINKRYLTEAMSALAKTQDSRTEGRVKSVF
jgi:hypothetical protein